MDGATLAVLLLGAYLVVSPDKISLSLTRGTSGAARHALGRRTTRGAASGRSKSAGGGSTGGRAGRTTFRQAVRQLWLDGRNAAAAARARRAAGHDTFSRMVRGGRAGAAGLVAARHASSGLSSRVRAGVPAMRTHWIEHAPVAGDPAGVTPVGRHDTSTSTGSPDPHEASEAAIDAATSKTNTLTAAAAGLAAAATTNTLTEKGETSMNVTELESLEAVRAEVQQAVQMAESLTEVVTSIKEWATGLADRWAGTEWGTKDLDNAVASVGEAASTLVGAEPLTEALVAVEDAVKRAEALGDVAAEIGAHGQVDAFRAA